MNEEIESLQKQLVACRERLTAARRRLPSEPVEDYTLRRADGSAVKLSELFAGKPDLLVIHNMGRRCAYCTLWADGFTGFTPHIQSRAALVLVSPDEPTVLAEFAQSRGWNYPLASAYGTSFIRDLGFESNDGMAQPGVSALRREGGAITRVARDSFGPGDAYCSIWHLFDLLKDGANGWEPKYQYA